MKRKLTTFYLLLTTLVQHRHMILKKLELRKITLCLLFTFSSAILHAQQEKDPVITALDVFMTENFPVSEPGASVLVIKDGETLLRKGYGMANIDAGQPSSPESIYRIGSITKQFTAIAILKLAQENKLSLQDDINRYFPEFTEKKITIEHLLQHTSGIKSYTSIPSLLTPEKKKAGITQKELLEVLKNEAPDFEPGEYFSYNNSGYYLLGMIIEKVSGQKYKDYISEHLLEPLKMKNTFISDKKLPDEVAVGYQITEEGNLELADFVHSSLPFSAGALYSTVDDLWKWNQGISSYKVVKKEWLDKAWAPLTLTSGKQESYGYGWFLDRFNGKKVIAHGGAIDGYGSAALYEPESKIFVCILNNGSRNNIDAYAYDLMQMASSVPQDMPPAIAVDEHTLHEYVGVYNINEMEERIITLQDNMLFSKRNHGQSFPLIPYEADAFHFKGSDAVLKFTRDASGKITGCEFYGQKWIPEFAAKTDKPLPTGPKEIKINPAIFDQYVGEYELKPGFTIKIWRTENHFKAQATGQPEVDLYAESERKFFLKVTDAQLVFNQDDLGNVVSMTLYQGGRTIEGKKIN